jgi:iron complex transport system ATP-binding protein
VRLAAHELAFGYPGRPVGRGVSLALETGEILCLLGPNGSGKTTLFKTLLGLLKAQGGDVSLDGVSIATLPRRRLAQAMAYVPQSQAGYFPFTVMDTVLMGRTARMGLFATPSRHDREAAWAALQTLHVGELAPNPYTRLSGGQRQLVLIARALAQEAQILLMDEPTAGLDFGNQLLVLDAIKRLAARGVGICFSTHDPNQALGSADRVAMLQHGRLVRYGSRAEVLTSESLRQLYGADLEIVELPGAGRICVAQGSRGTIA